MADRRRPLGPARFDTDPARWRHGNDLGRELGLKAGSLYPILIPLEEWTTSNVNSVDLAV
jgi:hypothetical protein